MNLECIEKFLARKEALDVVHTESHKKSTDNDFHNQLTSST